MKSLILSALAALALTAPALAGDCTGHVTGVRPLSQYNHASGAGFLAVRVGPGSNTQQIGELYAGDEISVWDRSGRWYYVRCMSGRCMSPLWGPAQPTGWVHGNYLTIGGVCP